MVDKSQQDLEREINKNLYEEESIKLDEDTQINTNLMIQDENDDEDEEDLESNQKLIAKIERRKSSLKNMKASTSYTEMNPLMRTNQIFSFENFLSMFLQMEKFSKEIREMRKRQIISEKLQAEMETEIEILRR